MKTTSVVVDSGRGKRVQSKVKQREDRLRQFLMPASWWHKKRLRGEEWSHVGCAPRNQGRSTGRFAPKSIQIMKPPKVAPQETAYYTLASLELAHGRYSFFRFLQLRPGPLDALPSPIPVVTFKETLVTKQYNELKGELTMGTQHF